jgi:two-component system response regulator HupR/HoxA
MGATVLLVEDNAEVATLLARVLRDAEERFHVVLAASATAGLQSLADHEVDCVLLDYRLPDADGLDALRLIRRRHPSLPVIVVTGAGTEEVAVEAMKLGAADYLVKHGTYLLMVPLLVRDALGRGQLGLALSSAGDGGTGDSGVARLQPEVRERYRNAGILGKSAAIEGALVLAERAGQSRIPVLLTGETGTGKELFARAIHCHGPRAEKPFVAVDCGVLPDGTIESELFGHVRGSFTGAIRDRRGLFEAAEGGTLFLDELGNTGPTFQAKLLRTLEDGALRPVGTNQTRTVDVRVIAATNHDLLAAVERGSFRRDLYYRLAAFPVRLPPLRERRGDISQLARHFLQSLTEQEGTPVRGFEPQALQLLERYSWPGNVRELRNEIHRLVLFAEAGKSITAVMLAPRIVHAAPRCDGTGRQTLKEIVRSVECAVIQARLREQGYNRSATARSLAISREALWAKMRQLGFVIGKGAKAP